MKRKIKFFFKGKKENMFDRFWIIAKWQASEKKMTRLKYYNKCVMKLKIYIHMS